MTKEVIPIFCHFQDWSKTIRMKESQESNSHMSLCPLAHYVYGMKIKLD
jgi:hypothetical protein